MNYYEFWRKAYRNGYVTLDELTYAKENELITQEQFNKIKQLERVKL